MNTRVQKLLDILEDYKSSPPGIGLELRLSLTELMQKHLKSKGWTQRYLADKAALKEAYISRVLHADANCTLDTVGKLLFALGIRARIQEEPVHIVTDHGVVDTICPLRLITQDDTHGKAISTQQEKTTQEGIYIYRQAEATTGFG